MSSLTIGTVGGSVTVQGDMTAGDKILREIQQSGTPTAEHLKPLIQAVIDERAAAVPNPATLEDRLRDIADLGVSTLIKVVTGILLR